MTVTARINGMDGIQAKLDALANPKKAKAMARKAARQAMNIVRDAARANVKQIDNKDTPEKIWKEIITQSGRGNANTVIMRVGVRGGARIPYTSTAANRRSGKVGQSYQLEGNVWYWRLVEFGRGSVTVGKKAKVLTDGKNFFGKKVAPTKAHPFMRPAFYNNIDAVTSKFAEMFSQQVEDELNKT